MKKCKQLHLTLDLKLTQNQKKEKAIIRHYIKIVQDNES